MDDHPITLDQVLALVRKLTPVEKARLIENVVPDLADSLAAAASPFVPGGTLGDLVASPLWGLWSDRTDLGDSPAFARQLRARAEQRPHERS